MKRSRVRAVAGGCATAVVLALTVSACGDPSADDVAADYCELLEERNAALADGDNEEVADVLGELADLLTEARDAGIGGRELADATGEKCPELLPETF